MRTKQRGFSFIELIVVMGAMGMLMGLAVGYLSSVGQATFIAQARAILSETAYRCINASSGGRRAILTMRQVETDTGGQRLRVGAAVAGPVLTHHFETLDFASEARIPDVSGKVEVRRGAGRSGNCAAFKGGHLKFTPQSVFAMTEGLELDVWLRPERGHRVMSVLQGQESYEVSLIQAGDSAAYDVRLMLKVRKANESVRSPAVPRNFETRGGVLMADGRWSRLQVSYDGLDATIRVNGLEVYGGEQQDRKPGDALQGEKLEMVQRIAIPPNGAVALTIGSGDRPYKGDMDALQLRGVFRSDELERDLPGQADTYEVLYPTLPLRIVFANGALDPDVHNTDQIIRIRDLSEPDDPPLRLTVGMFGVVSSVYEQPGSTGPRAETETKKPVTPADPGAAPGGAK